MQSPRIAPGGATTYQVPGTAAVVCCEREGERREMENGDGRVGTARQDWAGGRADFFNGRKILCFLFPHAYWVKKTRERRKGGRA